MTTTNDDRRGERRHSCLVEVQGMHGERFFTGRTLDLSATGAFIECGTFPARGEPVQLLFDVPPRLWRIEGTVVATRTDPPAGFGVSFLSEEGKVQAVARALAGATREGIHRPVLRSHGRLPCEVRVLGAAGDQVLETTAVDFSRGGAFLATPKRLPTGTFLTLRWQPPGGEPCDAPAVVRWTREAKGAKGGGIGVAFLREEPAIFAAMRQSGSRPHRPRYQASPSPAMKS